MNNPFSMLKVLTLIVSLGLGSASVFAQALDKGAIAEDISAAFSSYLSALAEGNADFIANEIYAVPSFNAQAQGPRLSRTSEELRVLFESQIAAMAADNFEKTEAPYTSICVLNESAAIVSSTFTRYRTDGSVMAQGGATYLFAKFTDSWKIVSLAAHRPEEVIRCAE